MKFYQIFTFLRLRLCLLLLLCSFLSVSAQHTVTVSGNIYDRISTNHLPHVQVAVLNNDSTVIVETGAYRLSSILEGNHYKEFDEGFFSFEIPVASTPYILRFEKEGYEPLSQSLDLSDIKGRQFELQLMPIYMSPQKTDSSVMLEELIVKTSMVKFYHKGDTIVYKADAFMLPEGSSLDALIAKLPGVEIREGGKIYVNGRFIESLLLNGKDFFKGNQDVLRQNLGAYSVKDIAVYDKYGQMSRLMDSQLEDDKEYVMDVRLKKDYMGGLMGNAWLGYGSDNRYIGRVFAMLFNNNARFSLYGNLNNINDTDRPNDGQGFTFNDDILEGLSEIANGGFDYYVGDMRKEWTVAGNVDISHIRNKTQRSIFVESFLHNNSFQTKFDNSRNTSLNISTSHTLELNKRLYFLNVKPQFRYNRSNSSSGTASVEFDSNMQERHVINNAVIDAIYTGSQNELREALINRNRFELNHRSNSHTSHIWSEQGFRFHNSPDAINVWIEGEYSRQHSRSRSDRSIDFGFNGLDAPMSSIAQRREKNGFPDFTGWIKGASRYFIKTRKSQFSIGYEYRHEQQRKSSLEFLCDSHTQDEEAYLPYDSPLLPDYSNTNTSKLFANIHMIKGSFDYSTRLHSKLEFRLSFAPEFHIRTRNLHYSAYQMENTEYRPVTFNIGRTSSSFSNSSLRIAMNTPDYRYAVSVQYKFQTRYVPLTNLITLPNTVDPLNVYHGNPNLKDAFNQNITFNFNSNPIKNTAISFNSSFDYTSRDLVKGYEFDSSTGIRNFQTVNVSGNLSNYESFSFYKSMQFGKHEIAFDANANYEFLRLSNMIGEDSPMQKQLVFSNHFGYSVNLRYNLMDRFSLSGGIKALNIYSRTNSINRSNTREQRLVPRASIELKLPYNLTLLGDINYLIISGTENEDMKPTQCLLNLNLRYQINQHWMLRLEGYDLLNQRKPYSNIVTAAGRTQTIVNHLPRYIMLTVGYNFNTRKD